MRVNETSSRAPESRGPRWARYGAAALVGAVATLAFSGMAVADPGDVTGGDQVHVLITSGDETKMVTAAELAITTVAGKKTPAFCIDINNPTSDKGGYTETDWNTSKVQNLDKIKWILTHSYPTATASTVAQAAGADITGITAGKDLNVLGYGATQAAIWHFSDSVTLAAYQDDKGLPARTKYAVITKIYDYLTGKADKASESEPQPTLKITPANATATAGAKAGPYTVVSGGGDTTLTATGGSIVDKNGAAVTTLTNGGQFWVTSPNAGTVTIKATGSGQIPIGRVFVVGSAPNKFQKLILAGVAGTALNASATATFSTAGASLPVTGSSVTLMVATGLVLLVGGAFAMMTMRRRRIRFTA